jgi:hypothetical protein
MKNVKFSKDQSLKSQKKYGEYIKKDPKRFKAKKHIKNHNKDLFISYDSL